MPSLKELQEERGKLETRMQELLDRAEKENRDLSEEEDGQFNSLHEKDIEFRSRIDRQQKLDAIAKENQELRSGEYREDEFPEGTAVTRNPEHRTQHQPHERRTDEDLAFEGWAIRSLKGNVGTHHREAANRLGVDINQADFGVELYGNREFRSLQRRKWEHRDLETGGGAGEANIIRTDFVAQLERAMLAFGGVLAVSTQFRTSSGNPMIIPTMDDTGNDGDDIDEAADVTASAADPTFSKVEFGAFKTSTMVKFSRELEEDAGFDLNGELASLLGERIARKLNGNCTLGNGTTAAQGIVTASTLGHTAEADDAIEADDILTLIHSVDPAYRNAPGVGFLLHDQILLELRKLKETGTDRYLWQPSMQLGIPDRLLGYPVNISMDMEDTVEADAKVMLFGNLRKHRIRMVRGVTLVVARELYAGTDEVAMIAHLRYDSRLMQTAAVKHLIMAGS